jgi:hypothetical protein
VEYLPATVNGKVDHDELIKLWLLEGKSGCRHRIP